MTLRHIPLAFNVACSSVRYDGRFLRFQFDACTGCQACQPFDACQTTTYPLPKTTKVLFSTQACYNRRPSFFFFFFGYSLTIPRSRHRQQHRRSPPHQHRHVNTQSLMHRVSRKSHKSFFFVDDLFFRTRSGANADARRR